MFVRSDAVGLELGERLLDFGLDLHREVDELTAEALRDAAQHAPSADLPSGTRDDRSP